MLLQINEKPVAKSVLFIPYEMKRKKMAMIIAGFLFCLFSLYAQTEDSKNKLYSSGLKLYNEGKYEEALVCLLKSDSLSDKKSQMTNYYIGLCYLHTKYEKVKAIPYLEFSIKKEKFIISGDVYLHLGDLYHFDYQFDKSMLNYNKYLLNATKKDEVYRYAEYMISVCQNAKRIIESPLNVKIINIGSPINTKHSEYSPLVATDQSIIYYTSLQNADLLNQGEIPDTLEHIYISGVRDDSIWNNPQEIQFNLSSSYQKLFLAGLSPDGEQLLLNIDGDIYTCHIINGKYSGLTKLNANINTEFQEERASLTADGSELYFASNRTGGFGGFDIYRSLKDNKNEWGTPVNLGSFINTPYDEAAPFIHPDKKTLYFSSKGHSTIGGYDIFKSYWFGENWYEPVNMGYPINTTQDDICFTLTADGQQGYFSSSKDNRFHTYDIYKVYLEKSIPITLVKGLILAGDPLQPVGAKIKVIDKETNTRIKYIYNPNPKTGKYLMIFPPGKNYDMIIEAEGFLPQLINIYIPNQSYFYELFQEIHLKPVKTAGTIIGEEVLIKNTFVDINQTGLDTIPPEQRDNVPKKDYGKLLNLIEGIIEASDSLEMTQIDKMGEIANNSSDTNKIKGDKNFDDLFNMIENAIETTDSTTLAKIEEKTLFDETTSQTYFYGNKKDMDYYIVDGDTIYTKPNFNARKKEEEKEIIPENVLFGKVKDDFKKEVLIYILPFSNNDLSIKEENKKDMEEIAALLINNSRLGLDIYGYSDLLKEKSANNELLAKERELAVTRFFMNKQVEENRLIKRGGSTKSDENINPGTKGNMKAVLKVFEVLPFGFKEENLIMDFSDYNEESLKKLKKGQEIRMKNIYFDFAKSEIRPESYSELDQVVDYLKNNTSVKIEVGGHTDNKNSFSTNMKLSTDRAKAVVNYLIRQSIDPGRLTFKGYAYLNPVETNETEAGRQQNRRVSFTIIEK